MKLIVGLGNPGREYAANRHNVGFMCLSHFAREHGIRLERSQCLARVGSGRADGEEVVLARPQTFMNLSGQSVSRLARKYKVAPADLLVIHDDLDLPPGRIRIRHGGRSGGHKGVDSIIALLGSRDFARIRVGIGRPEMGDENGGDTEIIDYVLGDFSEDEKEVIAGVIPRVSQAILCLLSEGIAAAMNRYNRDAH